MEARSPLPTSLKQPVGVFSHSPASPLLLGGLQKGCATPPEQRLNGIRRAACHVSLSPGGVELLIEAEPCLFFNYSVFNILCVFYQSVPARG